MKFFYAIVYEVTFYGVRVTSSPLATCVTKEPGHHAYTVMHRGAEMEQILVGAGLFCGHNLPATLIENRLRLRSNI